MEAAKCLQGTVWRKSHLIKMLWTTINDQIIFIDFVD